MTIEWFKAQTPLFSSAAGPRVLLYNESKSVYTEVTGDLAQQLIDGLGMSAPDKVFVEGMIDKNGQFIANRDTLTREEQF